MLVEIQLSGSGNQWSYQQPIIRIGRDPSCDVHLPSNDYPLVSRFHAVLEVTNGALQVVDPGSANGTFVNGKRVAQQTLANGDKVKLGENGPEFTITIKPELQTLPPTAFNVAFDDLSTVLLDIPKTAQAAVPQPLPEVVTLRPNSDLTSVVSPPDLSPTTKRRVPASVEGTRLHSMDPETLIAPNQHPGRVRFGASVAFDPASAPAPPPNSGLTGANQPPKTNPESPEGESTVRVPGIGLIQKLLFVNLLLTAGLLLVIFQQNQQIQSLKKGQDDAIQNFAPEITQANKDIQTSRAEFKNQVAEAEDSMRKTMREEEDRVRESLQRDIPPLVEKTINENISKYTGIKK